MHFTDDIKHQIMYIDDLTDAVVACAEAEGWKVEAGFYIRSRKPNLSLVSTAQSDVIFLSR